MNKKSRYNTRKQQQQKYQSGERGRSRYIWTCTDILLRVERRQSRRVRNLRGEIYAVSSQDDGPDVNAALSRAHMRYRASSYAHAWLQSLARMQHTPE